MLRTPIATHKKGRFIAATLDILNLFVSILQDVEQRVFVARASADEAGHMQGVQLWRKGGTFSLARFESVEINDCDYETFIAQDYSVRKRRKKCKTTTAVQVE